MWNQGGSNDGGYGDHGGGYMPQSQGFNSPDGEEKKKAKRVQTIVPVTSAQVFASEQVEEKFILDNIELHQVTIVGLIKSVNELETWMEYYVDDMTGPPIAVKHFSDNDNDTPAEERQVLRENTYVRVLGHVRAFGKKRHLAAFRLFPVTDPNEITAHMLEVIESYLILTKMANNAGYQQVSTTTGPSTGNTSNFSAQQDTISGLTDLQNQVHTIIKSCSDEQGISLSFICERLRGVPASKIRETADFLSTEGHIYSTIDDEHFKSTESL